MELGLHGKTIIVTGGSAGIGAAICRLLRDEGATPVNLSRDPPREAGIAEFHFVELTDETQIRETVQEITQQHGGIDGLVNNAGVNDNIGLEAGIKAFRGSLERNLIHYYAMAHHCLLYLRKSQGPILNIASKVALTGQGGTSGYAASKGGQLALTREWAAELAPDGIRVNAILPAEVDTEMYREWVKKFPDPQAQYEKIAARIPLGKRFTRPEEIAGVAVFLLSAQASHITGQFLVPDGGYVHLDRALT
jgi:L-fucose dehydrogenase